MSSDLHGHMGSIHPMDKTPVGQRLMLSAREHAYGEVVSSSGPEPLAAALSGRSLSLAFDPRTVGPAGLLLRTAGPVRQVCAVGQKQVGGRGLTAAIHVENLHCCSCKLTQLCDAALRQPDQRHRPAVAGESWLTAAIHMANPYCSCKLTASPRHRPVVAVRLQHWI